MPEPAPPAETSWPRLWLRRGDQLVVVSVVALALAAMWGHWLQRGGHQGRRIEIERVQPGAITFQVDINAADWPELTVLPGLGETLARRIVSDRELNGPFRDLDDLRRVRGIGPRTMERLTPYLQPLPNLESTAKTPEEGKNS